jgi:hypothetical protein
VTTFMIPDTAQAPLITPEHLRWFALLHPELMSRLASRMTAHRAATVAELYAWGTGLDDIIWIVSTLAGEHADFRRRLRLWSADCVAHALQYVEATHPADSHVPEAIVAARRFARGVLLDMTRPHEGALSALDVAPDAAARALARAAAAITHEQDSWADNAAAKAMRDLSGAAWQLDRLVRRFAAHEPDDVPLPATRSTGLRRDAIVCGPPTLPADAGGGQPRGWPPVSFSSCARSAQPALHRSSSP